jgi:Methyltransferase domain
MCHQITDATEDRFSISSIQLADLGRNFPTSWLLTWRSALVPPWRPVPIQSRCNRFDACFVVAILHQDGQSNQRQLSWIEGSALNLPFPSACFDVVLCQLGFQFAVTPSACFTGSTSGAPASAAPGCVTPRGASGPTPDYVKRHYVSRPDCPVEPDFPADNVGSAPWSVVSSRRTWASAP